MEGGWRPSSASSSPAFCRDSVYFVIATTAWGSGMAPGFAFSYPFGIISIMNRIARSPSGLGLAAGPPPGLDRLNRAPTYTSNDRQQDRQVRYLFWKHLLRVGLHNALSFRASCPARLARQEANQRPDRCANL